MILKVTGNNERIYTPDLGDNLKQDIEKQFSIKVRKLSLSVHSDKWTKGLTGSDESGITIDLKKYIKEHVIGLINPPILQDGKNEIELDMELLFSDKYEELYVVIEDLLAYIQDMYSEDTADNIKK